jgi:hypothetical protein
LKIVDSDSVPLGFSTFPKPDVAGSSPVARSLT